MYYALGPEGQADRGQSLKHESVRRNARIAPQSANARRIARHSRRPHAARPRVAFHHYDARRRRSLSYPPVTQGAPSAASAGWKYDDDGNVTEIDTPNGRTRILTVNALNRLTHESIDNATAGEISDVAYTHDGNGNVLTIAETIGSVTRTATRSYDVLDRLSTDVDVHHKSLLYGYDDAGNRLSVTDNTDPNHQAVITVWTYNALNQNTSVTVPGQGTTLIDNYPSGLVHVVTRPGSITTTTQYDPAGRIATITHANADGEIAHDAYDYDLNGNRTYQHERNGDLTQNAELTTAYTYDKNDWLTDIAVSYGSVAERTTHYVLDNVGNRTTEQIRNAQGALISDSTLAYNEREQLTSRDDSVSHLHVDITYDADGNTATETDSTGTLHFGWDGHDRLLALGQNLQSPNLIFDYQSDGLRIAKTQVGGAETDYHYDGQSLLTETNNQGNLLVRYHYSATELLSRTETSGVSTERHYLNDALNTPIATMNQGAVDSRTTYDAWGEITAQQGQGGAITNPSTDGTFAELPSTDNQDIGFTGYVKDSETGFYYAKARYYDPRIARFASGDPEEGKAMEPPSLNRYLYAYANPAVYTDPSGRVSYFTTIKDFFDSNAQYYHEAALRKDNDTIDAALAGVGGALSEVGGAPFRLLNYLSNVGADYAGRVAPNTFSSSSEQATHDLEGTFRAAEKLGDKAAHPERTRQEAIAVTVAAMEGDPESVAALAGTATTLGVGLVTPRVGPAVEARGAQASQVALRQANFQRDFANDLEQGFSRGGHERPAPTLVADATSDGRLASRATPSELHSELTALKPPVGAGNAVQTVEQNSLSTTAQSGTVSADGEVVYVHRADQGDINYIGITGDTKLRSRQHRVDPEKTGSRMEVVTDPQTHGVARTIEAKLIRRRLDAARAKGLIDGTEPIQEQLSKAAY